MVARNLDARTVERAVLGSVALARGGGGDIELGLRLGQIAVELGRVSLVSLDALKPDARIVAVGTWGDGAGRASAYRLSDHRRAIDLLALNTRSEFSSIAPFGGGALNLMASWSQAALLGVPLIDGVFGDGLDPCAGRGFVELLAAEAAVVPLAMVRSGREDGERQETFLRGNAGALVRQVGEIARGEGVHALACGPLPLEWARKHAEPEGISRAIQVGDALLRARADGGGMAARAVSQALGGEGVTRGIVSGVDRTTRDGASLVTVTLLDEADCRLKLTHWHRYLSLHVDEQQVAAFPDLIVTLGATGTPLQVEELTEGQDVYIVTAQGAQAARDGIGAA